MNEYFLKITGFNIGNYFDKFVSFITNKSQSMINYYSGLTSTLSRDVYSEYSELLKESVFVLDLFDLNKGRFNTVDFWELMEFCEDIKIKLETIGNFSIYARSSVDKESFTTDVTIETSTRENETLEELINRYGSTDRDTDWVNLALSNSIIQEDYDNKGGLVIKITFKNNSKFFINSIVGNPEGEKIKGLDVYKKLTYEDNDLIVLSYDETLSQSIDTLINLRKGNNPEFPEYGVDSSLIVGVAYKAIMLPSIIRQIYQTFSSDDIISRIEVLNTLFNEDSLNLDLNISVKSGEEQQRILSI